MIDAQSSVTCKRGGRLPLPHLSSCSYMPPGPLHFFCCGPPRSFSPPPTIERADEKDDRDPMRGLFHRKETSSNASRHSVSEALSASKTIATAVAAAPSSPPSPFSQNSNSNSSPSLEQRQQRPRSGLFGLFHANPSNQSVISSNLETQQAGKEKQRYGRSHSRSPVPSPLPTPAPSPSRAYVQRGTRTPPRAQIKMPEPEPYRPNREKSPVSSPTSDGIPQISIVSGDNDNDDDGILDRTSPVFGNSQVDRGFKSDLSDSDDDNGKSMARVPLKGTIQVGMAAGKLAGDFLSPLPWVGPAIELVATIVTLCQNVGRNT